jgi:signal transduction histidine kinase
VLGARLAGYASLSRFGESLTRVPGSAALLRDLAGEIRRGLDLTWTRVSLEPPGGQADAVAEGPVVDGTAAGEAAAIVPIEHRGTALGRIECGPRTDGPLLAEDRRLLAYFAAHAAVGVHNLYLAAELAASRSRIVAAQDAERRRIQAVLHDGVQQEIVALSAKAGLVRQQLLRGEAAAADGLAEMQRDLATTLHDAREIAYAIHQPVLSDRGLLEAIEAQSSRLAMPMAVRADPGLRGVRFAAQIEATAWYVLAEALSNVVKHAKASEVEVSLVRPDGTLGLVIRDDGCGFDPGQPRGLGLTGLSDRLDTVGGKAGAQPAMEGIDAAHAIRSAYPRTGVVVLSQYADESYAFELFRDGTAGLAYLLKDRIGDLSRLLDALREVSTGGSVIDPQVVEALVRGRARVRASALKHLTPRDLDVLREMAQGRGNAGIAAQL